MGRGQFGYGNLGNTEFLGKKAVNKAVDAFSRKQVVVGDNAEGKSVQTAQFRASLQRSTLPPMSDGKRAGFNVVLPRVFETLFKTDESAYIAGIGGEETAQLADIGIKLASGDDRQSVAFRVVFGATEQMPLRALSYIIPPLVMMERLKEETGNAPQLQVVFANQISGRLNRLDERKITDQSQQFSRTAREYIGEFFPELGDSTIFLSDTSLGIGTPLRNELATIAKALGQHLSPETKEVLFSKGDGTGRLNPYYGAAHLLMHDVAGSKYLKPLLEDQPDFMTSNAIVSFGGSQERLFYKIRHELKPHLGEAYNSVKTFQYFTRHHVPPYYMARGGDVSFEDALSGKMGDLQIGPAAMRDLDYLRNISMTRGDFYEFLKNKEVCYEK